MHFYTPQKKTIHTKFYQKILSKKSMINVFQATEKEVIYVETILTTIAVAAKKRGTGIASRTPEYVTKKILEGKAIIAIEEETGTFAGFCYIESWDDKKFVANSGLIVSPDFQGHGLAKRIKQESFRLSREMFPNAKLFGLTTGLAVMKINSGLGYRPVPFSELTDDEAFWNSCKSCVNYPILMSKERKMCLCTGMLYDPKWEENK